MEELTERYEIEKLRVKNQKLRNALVAIAGSDDLGKLLQIRELVLKIARGSGMADAPAITAIDALIETHPDNHS